jgi:hypothetical protein
MVLRHCARWRTIRLQGAHRVPNWLLFINGQLEQLQNFEVENAAQFTAIPDIFSPAPNLCQVFLTEKILNPR